MIQGTLWPFLKQVKEAVQDDKLWSLYLRSMSNKSYDQWKEEVLQNG